MISFDLRPDFWLENADEIRISWQYKIFGWNSVSKRCEGSKFKKCKICVTLFVNEPFSTLFLCQGRLNLNSTQNHVFVSNVGWRILVCRFFKERNHQKGGVWSLYSIFFKSAVFKGCSCLRGAQIQISR